MVTVETLDGRTLSIPSPGVLAAGAVLRVADEGIAGKVLVYAATHSRC